MAVINGSFASNSKNLQPYIDYSYSQNTDNITTTVTATLYVKKLTSYGNTWASSTPYSLSIGGTTVSSGRKSVDMRNVGVGASVAVTSGSRTISHDSNGNLYVSLSGVVDWSGSNPGKGTVSGGFNPPTIVVNTAPSMRGSLSVSPSGTVAENTQTISLSWSKASDSQNNANKYIIYRYINDAHNHTIEVNNINTLSTSDNIGWTGQGTKIHYQIWAADTYGVWSNGIVSAVIRKNTFTPITLGASGNIYHSTGNQTVTLTRTGGSNTAGGGTVLSELTARIGSTRLTVYNATAGGNLTIVPGTQSVSNPHIRLGDIRSALAGSSYNGALTLSLYSRNNWGSDGSSARDVWVDLRTEPVPETKIVTIDPGSFFAIPGVGSILVPNRRVISLNWNRANDPNGTPVTYRVEQQIGTGGWTTLTSSTSNIYYDFNLNVSGKPSHKWRVYAKNSYGREVLIGTTSNYTLYNYTQPSIVIGVTTRTASEFTISFSTSISNDIGGNAIQSIVLNYNGKDTSLTTNATSAKLTGLSENSTGPYKLTVTDIHGSVFGVVGGSADGYISQFYPVLSIRKNGVGIKTIPDGSADFIVEGSMKCKNINIRGYQQLNPEGAYVNQWIKIATLRIPYRYGNSGFTAMISGEGNGGGHSTNGTIIVRLKQQEAMGGPPSGSITIYDEILVTKECFKLIIVTNNASETVGELWFKNTVSYESVYVSPLREYGEVNFFEGLPYQTSLPSGAQIHCGSGGISVDNIYPVGSIYMNVNDINPSTLFGGTWVRWGSGKVPVGVDTSQGEFNSSEKTGGAKSYSASHTHGTNNHTLTISQMPAHRHSVWSDHSGNHSHNLNTQKTKWGSGGGNYVMIDATSGYTALTNKTTTTGGNHNHPIGMNNEGGGGAHNHGNTTSSSISLSSLQPYITCYMWKRTA